MEKEEFSKIARMLAGNYSFMRFDSDTRDLWFVSLQHFSFDDVHKGVLNYIAFSPKQPTIADIVEASKAVRDRREPEWDWTKSRTVKCPKCRDKGAITIIYPTGLETCKICDCMVGKAMFSQKIQPRPLTDFDVQTKYGVNNLSEYYGLKLKRHEKISPSGNVSWLIEIAGGA